MEHILLIVMLAGGTHGLFQGPETKCDATQPPSPCSPVLGGSVSIKLMTTATGYILKCYKDVTAGQAIVFSFKRTATIEAPYQNRTEFISDTGTLKISNVKKSDTGRYIVNVHNSEGEFEKDVTFILDVKENINLYLIPVCAVLGVLILALCCCVCCKMKRCRKSGGSQARAQSQELQPSADLNSGTISSSSPPVLSKNIQISAES